MRVRVLLLVSIVTMATILTMITRNLFFKESKACGGDELGATCEYVWSSGWPFKYVSGFTESKNPLLLNFSFYLLIAVVPIYILYSKVIKKAKRR